MPGEVYGKVLDVFLAILSPLKTFRKIYVLEISFSFKMLKAL